MVEKANSHTARLTRPLAQAGNGRIQRPGRHGRALVGHVQTAVAQDRGNGAFDGLPANRGQAVGAQFDVAGYLVQLVVGFGV